MIDEYSFGGMVIDSVKYTKDIIILPDSIQDNWWRKEAHNLYLKDIENTLNISKPDVLVVGTGKFGLMRIDGEVIEFLKRRNIEFHALPSAKAVKLFNQIESKGKRVAGAFHLTC